MRRSTKPICVLLVFFILSFYSLPAYAEDSCFRSQAKGELDAGNNHSSSGWVLGGLASGVLLGLIGTAIITGVSAASNPSPSYLETPKENDVDMSCYLNGYKNKAKHKNMIGALTGGIAGTAIFVLIWVGASN